MSKAHIEKLETALNRSKWVLRSLYGAEELVTSWIITKPNGDNLLKLNFYIWGNGQYGAHNDTETIYNATSCSVDNYPDIKINFGKFHGSFKEDLILFVEKLNCIQNYAL